jgi:hypothetical protein
VRAKVQPAAGLQGKVRAEKAGNAANVLLLSRAAKAKRLSPLKAVATLAMMKAASRTSIAKMQIVKLLLQAGRSVLVATVHMAEAEIAEAVLAAGTAEVAAAAAHVAEAIVVLVAAVEIAATARTAISHQQIAISL